MSRWSYSETHAPAYVLRGERGGVAWFPSWWAVHIFGRVRFIYVRLRWPFAVRVA